MSITSINRRSLTRGIVLLAALAASGCQSSTPLPAPAGICVGEDDGTIAVYRWKDGPVVVICADVVGASSTTGSFSGPPWTQENKGTVSAKDGRRFEWLLETKDGKSIKCRLDGTEYDLAKGSLFLVKTRGGKTAVEQIKRDVSAVQATVESCKEFARKNEDVAKLLAKPADK